MAAPQNFRTSFNGFNREDVVRYLEYINARHHSQTEQLSSEIEYLRQQLDQYQSGPMVTDEIDALQTQCASLQAQLEESLSIRRALEARCNGLERELEEAIAAKKQAEEAHSATCCHVEQELEAYRRARERAELVYDRTNGILADATAQVDGVADQIGSLADTVMEQLEQLRSVVGTSKDALKSAASSLYGLRSEEE